MGFLCHAYSHLSNIQNIDEPIQQMHAANLQTPGSCDIAYELKNFLANRYRDAASVNRENNRMRSAWFANTFIALYVTVMILFVLIGVAGVCRWIDSDSPQKVELTGEVITSSPVTEVSVVNPLTIEPISVLASCSA